jgi:uncharacterized protein YehS (DUF1456 family)
MTNNNVIKKLRIALDLKETDMFQIFEMSGHPINKSLLSSIFRKEDNKNFRVCSDELLENFLDGYIIYKRGKKKEAPDLIKC